MKVILEMLRSIKTVKINGSDYVRAVESDIANENMSFENMDKNLELHNTDKPFTV